jgi:hypothetical protein
MEITVEEIENLITRLPQERLQEFRVWYEKFDAHLWDEQIHQDIDNGNLDSLAAQAIAAHKAGRSRKL